MFRSQLLALSFDNPLPALTGGGFFLPSYFFARRPPFFRGRLGCFFPIRSKVSCSPRRPSSLLLKAAIVPASPESEAPTISRRRMPHEPLSEYTRAMPLSWSACSTGRRKVKTGEIAIRVYYIAVTHRANLFSVEGCKHRVTEHSPDQSIHPEASKLCGSEWLKRQGILKGSLYQLHYFAPCFIPTLDRFTVRKICRG